MQLKKIHVNEEHQIHYGQGDKERGMGLRKDTKEAFNCLCIFYFLNSTSCR